MNDNAFQQVMSAIRSFYARRKVPIPVSEVYRLVKNMKQKEVRNALIYLKSNDAIRFNYNDMMITPVLTQEETDFIEAKAVAVDEIKIKNCIKVFFLRNSTYPSSDDIASTFISMYGMAKPETLTRYVRFMAEDRKIGRTEDHKYFLKELNPIGIKRFVI